MKLLKFLVSKVFFKNLAIAIGAVAVILLVTFQFLKIYTYHGKYLQVPELEGYTEIQLKRVLDANQLRYDIIDSVYSKRHLPGTVVEQIPAKGAKVKKNRKVFIIINAKEPEMVLMPNLKDVSLRQAKNILESSGLKVGEIMYVHSPYKNLVIEQHFDHVPIEPGTRILKNSDIDLEVGKGLGNTMEPVPDLKGLRVDLAKEGIASASMNLGVVIEDESTQQNPDSAFVWKQRPTPDDGAVRVGTSIDIWLTLDSTLLLPDSTQIMEVPDSIDIIQ